MANTSQLRRPEVQAKRKENARFVHLITQKAYDWGIDNGYATVLEEVAVFMEAYKKLNQPKSYWDNQSPERLLEIISETRARMDKAMAALSKSSNANGHH